MQYSIQGGSLPAVIIQMAPGETLISEVGGRTWSRGPILTETKGGSVGKALGRMISGESIFLNHYTAQGPAEIAFARPDRGQRAAARRKRHLPEIRLPLRNLRGRAVGPSAEKADCRPWRRRRLYHAEGDRSRPCVL